MERPWLSGAKESDRNTRTPRGRPRRELDGTCPRGSRCLGAVPAGGLECGGCSDTGSPGGRRAGCAGRGGAGPEADPGGDAAKSHPNRRKDLKTLQYEGMTVSLYPDFTLPVQETRRQFIAGKKQLRDLQLEYRMLYPTKL
ncbi:hypothetical protein NDU88_004165 [Pleurodeles waltl]|uniref:Uncharacterized protein n=1 Tax=Pleurodeles waltl TaxID=8319 RepID=A0AAV7MT70_PLEWA|nr:hypothetical protein NDU88_004165 [Pleurodeles waltl]